MALWDILSSRSLVWPAEPKSKAGPLSEAKRQLALEKRELRHRRRPLRLCRAFLDLHRLQNAAAILEILGSGAIAELVAIICLEDEIHHVQPSNPLDIDIEALRDKEDVPFLCFSHRQGIRRGRGLRNVQGWDCA